jgi:hypothetical protein
LVFKSDAVCGSKRVMRVTLVWATPKPERTIAVAMRRCYSTKPIEDIEFELEQKGQEYWKYLLTRALQDKSLDVMEHFCLTLLLENMAEADVCELVRDYPYARILNLGGDSWLLSLNSRTLIEMWRDGKYEPLVKAIVLELESKDVCPVLSALAFGEINAR